MHAGYIVSPQWLTRSIFSSLHLLLALIRPATSCHSVAFFFGPSPPFALHRILPILFPHPPPVFPLDAEHPSHSLLPGLRSTGVLGWLTRSSMRSVWIDGFPMALLILVDERARNSSVTSRPSTRSTDAPAAARTPAAVAVAMRSPLRSSRRRLFESPHCSRGDLGNMLSALPRIDPSHVRACLLRVRTYHPPPRWGPRDAE